MLRVCFLLLTLAVVVLSVALPPKHKDASHPEPGKRAYYLQLEGLEKRDHIREGLEKRDHIREGLEKRDHIRAFYEQTKDKRYLARKRAVSATLQAPAAEYYTGFTPVYTYVVLPDGTVTYTLQAQPAPQVQISQPIVQQPTSGSGGFLGFLKTPLNAVGDIVGQVTDTASNIVSLPFNVANTAVQGVLGGTGVGQVASGILDVGKAVVNAPVDLVSAVGQAPFRLAANVVKK